MTDTATRHRARSVGRHALSPGVAAPLRTWVASRAALLFLAFAGAWQLGGRNPGEVRGFVTTWDRWDVGLFVKIARYGYSFGSHAHYADPGTEAFFPGMPLLMRLLHPLVPGFLFPSTAAGANSRWVVTAMVVALLAGAIAVVALWRLARLELDDIGADRAVLYFVIAPYAVFLVAGYSETLFLAFALPGWLMARRGRWRAAGLLVAAAAFVRVTGVFLAVGLVVEYLTARRRSGRRVLGADAAWLLAPLVTVGGYVGWLHAKTGHWDAWQRAQAGPPWNRHFVGFVTAWRNTWEYASGRDFGAEYVWSYRAEIVAVLVGALLVIALLARRRWGEATYVGLNWAALATSSFYFSVTRALLGWFPLYLLLAGAARARPWVHSAIVWSSATLLAVLTLTFTSGRWIG